MAQFLDLTGLARYKNKSDALYAKQDGSYEGMTVGNAEQLVSTVGVEDSAPYTFRTTGGYADVGDRMNLKAVVGGTVAWNQLAFELSSNNWSNTGSVSYSDGIATAHNDSSTGALLSLNLATGKKANVYAGHKYLFIVTVQTVNGQLNLIPDGTTSHGSLGYATYTSKTMIKYLWNCETNDELYFLLRGYAGYGVTSAIDFTVENPMCIDLTAMFGSTIADYVYTLESGTAGAGIAWLKKYGWFTKPYYPYKAAALESVKTSAHKTYGFNAYNPSTGKAKVVGGMVYQITGAYTALSLDGTSITPDASGYFTPSANGELTVTGGNSTTTCIHLKWDGERDGEWEEFSEHTYALDDVELRGVLKLDASNNLYYDGDEYAPDGTVTRKYAIRAYTSGDATDGSTMITDGTNTVYKLTTPTTESADAYTELQICDDFGTEEFVDAATRDFDMPCGSLAVYRPNLRAKLEMSPNSPEGDGDYLVRQTNGVNEYVLFSEVKELPDYPTTDGTYVLKCTVADGTATLSWVSE